MARPPTNFTATVQNMLPDRPADARQRLTAALEQADKAITEGRDAVQGLRASTVDSQDLAQEVTTLGDELARGAPRPPSFHVAVEEAPRQLHPIVRDEIYKIAAEALRNAYGHAEARQIDVELHYGDDELRMRVRDDGKGIDSTAVLASHESAGHFGLRGLTERAALAGGKLAIRSDVGAGTEVELRVPARVAYAPSARRRG
jgi:signal transduction histidine kinase